jgi:hypothetical protein
MRSLGYLHGPKTLKARALAFGSAYLAAGSRDVVEEPAPCFAATSGTREVGVYLRKAATMVERLKRYIAS